MSSMHPFPRGLPEPQPVVAHPWHAKQMLLAGTSSPFYGMLSPEHQTYRLFTKTLLLISHLVAVHAYMRLHFEQGCLIARLCSLHQLVPANP